MQEWYLDNQIPNIGGFESDAITDYAQSDFQNLLYTSVAKDLVLYSHDMSEQTNIRGVVQGVYYDTREKSTDRQLLVPIGTCNAGMYIGIGSKIYLIDGMPDNNGVYEKATMVLCNWLFKWQNSKGEIISRWGNFKSASKYNDGTTGNSVIEIGSDQLSVTIPLDYESIHINRGIKFFIDYNEDNPTVYELSNPTNVLYHYGENNGVTHWIVKETPYSPTTDDLMHGVCNYRTQNEQNPVDIWRMVLSYKSTNLYLGGAYKDIDALLVDANDNEVYIDADSDNANDIEYVWTVTSNISNYIDYVANGKSFKIRVLENDICLDETITIMCASRWTGQSASVEMLVKG